MSFTASYIFVGARHLPHPTDLNAPRTDLQIQNFQRFAGRLPKTGQEAVAGISIPSGTSTTGVTVGPGTQFTNPYGVTCAVVIPGMVAQCPTGRVVTPAIANFFRPNSPNYFLASALSGGAVSKAVLDSQLAGTLRTPGLISPFGAVNAQVSDGNSSYNAMNLEFKRRFANNFTFLASLHLVAFDRRFVSDLQTLLIAQNPRNHRLERADSLFDQRHRFVFSGVLASPDRGEAAADGRDFWRILRSRRSSKSLPVARSTSSPMLTPTTINRLRPTARACCPTELSAFPANRCPAAETAERFLKTIQPWAAL